MPMYGYANRKCGQVNGTRDPLFALVGQVAVGTGHARPRVDARVVHLKLGMLRL